MNVIIILLSLAIFECNDGTPINKKINPVIDPTIDNNTKKVGNDFTGVYDEISIAVHEKSITGTYEYYDKWSEKYKEFLDINVFYFSGQLINDSTAIINTSCVSCHQKLTGSIIFKARPSNSLRIKLSAQPDGYNDVDFTQKEGVEFKQSKKTNWTDIKYIKSGKAFLYDKPGTQNLRKAYLVKDDYVKVLPSSIAGFLQVEYDNPVTQKNFTCWIKKNDLD